MSVDTCGALKSDVGAYDIWNFVKNNFDKDAKIEQYQSYSNYIIFHYDGDENQRELHVFTNGHDYRDFTGGYSEDHEITEISVGQWGHYQDIIEPIVKHFGGWYIPSDCSDESIFYEFNNSNVTVTPIEKYVFDKLVDDTDWKLKVKVMQFIENNLDEIKKL